MNAAGVCWEGAAMVVGMIWLIPMIGERPGT